MDGGGENERERFFSAPIPTTIYLKETIFIANPCAYKMSVLTYCESVKTQGKGARFSTKILDSKTQYLKRRLLGAGPLSNFGFIFMG